ncbi:MAG: NAD(P)/FAD-dependent oxidoreductase [Planctomycetota bacterium]|nr:NAD(P)/FAD-dependent oxidoreductase [Planctomycetota bacterium]
MLAKVDEILASIERLDSGKPRKRITILGAGIASLVAAYELSTRGHRVKVVEATKRVGGRAHTYKVSDDVYHELGAMRIPTTHEFTRHYALDVCGLTLRRFVNHHDRQERFYNIRGIVTSHAEAFTRLLPSFRLSEREKRWVTEASTILALFTPLGQVTNEVMASPVDLDALFGRGPMTDRIKELGQLTLGDFLRRNLDTSEAVDLLGAVTGLEVWWDKAFTMLLRDEISTHGSGGVLHEIVGGTEELPKALREMIKDRVEIQYERVVREIHARANAVQIVTSAKDGTDRQRTDEDFVLCTIPFSVLRRLELTGVSIEKQRAIRNLTYASSTKVLLHCAEKFWEAGGVVGGGSQLDSLVRQVYYPSAEAQNEPGTKRGLLEGVWAERLDTSIKAGRESKPGILVGSYCWDADARRLGAIPKCDRVRVVADHVSEIHPELRLKGMVLGGESMFWDENPWAAGAFCFMRPGDFELYYSDTRKREGRLYFAGEHCSLDQGWMQGAIQSSLEAVNEIVSA